MSTIQRKPVAVASTGAVYLSPQSAPVEARRTPTAIGPVSNITYSAYMGILPSADLTIVGISDTTTHGVPIRAMLFDSFSKLITQSSNVTVAMQSGTYAGRFPAPITLLAGELYYLGWSSVSYGALKAATTATSYSGFTVHPVIYTSSDPLGKPGNYTSGYYGTFSILALTGETKPKSVVGPLDTPDFPIVNSVDALIAGAAILDDGVNPPRLIRKRTDGSVWYGSNFTAQP